MFLLLRQGPLARWGGVPKVVVVFQKLKWCSKKWHQNPHPVLSRSGWWPCGSLGGVPKVAPEPSPYMVLPAVWLVALWLDGVVFQNVASEPPPCILLNKNRSATKGAQQVSIEIPTISLYNFEPNLI